MKYQTLSGMVLLLLLNKCGTFKPVGSNLADGALEKVRSDGPATISAIGKATETTLRDSLLTEALEVRLSEVVSTATDSVTRRLVAIRDSLLGEYTALWIKSLRNEVLGEATKVQLAAIRDELLGPNTQELLGGLANGLITDSTLAGVGHIRDELLGPNTSSAIDSIVSSAITTLETGYREKLQPLVREEEGFLKDNITAILLTAGGVIAGLLVLAGVIFIKGRRNRRISELLTYQIHQIPNQDSYDELTQRIRAQAQEIGLEPHLRKLLQERGILGTESWTPSGNGKDEGVKVGA
ncbi:hypothetical protein GWO43_29445 [candidate division KSB1 bacterium]|nr:hypothetical protein [candidate division KSB1 bacterium]NIR69887.1 hypothetical protein [candidate division KSB1 bacterium]NIS28040.1 hypothetical protein [candidate division KSB1 bacterium]NIT74911.1 hypothetical protein [candidate division KSB1 bacterium]NIU28695.1 hypothetical protein [candidate division KSB1 bacterium]